jgi:hypothetical protein
MSDEGRMSDEELLALGRRALQALPDAPAELQRRAEAIWPERPGLLQRILAFVALDSWAEPLPALRSDAPLGRQLLFTTEFRDIDLRVVPGPDGWTLEGQVLGPVDGGSVSLRSAGEPIADGPLDDLGTFRLSGLAEGRYQLLLYFATDRVELPELDVRPRDAQ